MNLPRRPGDLMALDANRCVELLETTPFVRIAFTTADGPNVLPVNHLLHDGAVHFRTSPGSKLATAAADGLVAVEADEADLANRTAWSVVAHGRASIVVDEALIEVLMAAEFEPWALPGEQAFWVRIDVHSITGRQIVR